MPACRNFNEGMQVFRLPTRYILAMALNSIGDGNMNMNPNPLDGSQGLRGSSDDLAALGLDRSAGRLAKSQPKSLDAAELIKLGTLIHQQFGLGRNVDFTA
jgi:hypothetical protein